MSLLNWMALVLSVVLWVLQLNIGHGIGMASSSPIKKGSSQDIYIGRLEKVRAILFLGALLTFITQLIPVPIVKTVGLMILAISLFTVAILWSGLLSRRLPTLTDDDQ